MSFQFWKGKHADDWDICIHVQETWILAPRGDQMDNADVILYVFVAYIDILIIFFILQLQIGNWLSW